jgi:uncharacterized protein (TIGR03437 family)
MKCIPLILLWTVAAGAADFATGQAARVVIGQQTFTASNPNPSDTTIGAVGGIAYAGNTLFVADSNGLGAVPSNNRLLLFQNLSSMVPQPTAELPYNIKCPVCVGQATLVLGQPDFTTTTENTAATQEDLWGPSAVASDGIHLVVADTNHNRVMIWNSIPTVNDAPADVVVGQVSFIASPISAGSPSASTMRGPQGVWIQNGRLYVADTGYNRVLIYNHIPTTNSAAADVVLGAPNFTTYVQPGLAGTGTIANNGNGTNATGATASTMLNPVSVTSDGAHVFVTDLGYNRVLIWNEIPTSNGQPADVVVGQPDMVSSIANNSFIGVAAQSSTDTTNFEQPVLCTTPTGMDPIGNPTYPNVCDATLNFPRFALSDGTRLFIADGGNDRVVEFLHIPTKNGAPGDTLLGQIGGTVDQATNAADSMDTPTALAWDGANLYVSDPYNLRVTVYTPANNVLPYQAVVNSASLSVLATGQVTIGGLIHAGDEVTLAINSTPSYSPDAIDYNYTVGSADTLYSVIAGLVGAINGSNNGVGDPNVSAAADDTDYQVILTAKQAGTIGNTIGYAITLTGGAQITAVAAGSTLTGGGSAAKVAPGTLVTISGANLSAGTASADLTQTQVPTELGGTEVYFNGVKSPLLFVSPTQINAQIPWEFTDGTDADPDSINAYVRSVMSDGSVMVTTPVAVTMLPANPGIFTSNGTQKPEIAVAVHSSSYATGIISVDGGAFPGDLATVNIEDRTYTYTVQSGDTLNSIRDSLVALIDTDPQVTAQVAAIFDRILLHARVAGPEGNSITYSASNSAGADVVMTALSSTLCCANVKGSPLTQGNPAVAGEIITVYATGLGLPAITTVNANLIVTGQQYPVGAPPTVPTPSQFVSATAGGSTADVLAATLVPGMLGIFEVDLHLNTSLANNLSAPLTIAQNAYISNSVTIPIVAAQ